MIIPGGKDEIVWWVGKMQEEGIFVAAEQAENARPS